MPPNRYSAAELRDILLQEIAALRTGEVSYDHALAVAELARNIVASTQIEVDLHRAVETAAKRRDREMKVANAGEPKESGVQQEVHGVGEQSGNGSSED